MSTMTWAEFKSFVDKELRKRDIDDSVLIDHIDIKWPDQSHEIGSAYVVTDWQEGGFTLNVWQNKAIDDD